MICGIEKKSVGRPQVYDMREAKDAIWALGSAAFDLFWVIAFWDQSTETKPSIYLIVCKSCLPLISGIDCNHSLDARNAIN
jgi:hypothetical protein